MDNNTDIVTQLTNLVIRPHRQIYGLDRLGSKKMLIRSKINKQFVHVNRKDVTICSQKKLQLSIFEPQSYFQNQHKKQCPPNIIIFLHSNSGSRLEGIQYAKQLLQYDIITVLFDYSGSGISQGQYVTMGINQSNDLQRVFQYLEQNYHIKKVGLWGRSMGAATGILYTSKYPNNVYGLVIDSSFCSFKQLIKDLATLKTGLPQFLFSPIISKIQSCIIQKTNINLFDLDLSKNILSLKLIPCLFLTSKNDQLVPASHTQKLYQLHQGQRQILYLQGHHNQPRSQSMKQTCSQFLLNSYKKQFLNENLKIQQKLNINIGKKYTDGKASLKNYPNKRQNNLSNKLNYGINKIPDMLVNNYYNDYVPRQQKKQKKLSYMINSTNSVNNKNSNNISNQQNPSRQIYYKKLNGTNKFSLSQFKKSYIFPQNKNQCWPQNIKIQQSTKSDSSVFGSENYNSITRHQPIKQHINFCYQVPNQLQMIPNKFNIHRQ